MRDRMHARASLSGPAGRFVGACVRQDRRHGDRLAVSMIDHRKLGAAALRGPVAIVDVWAMWVGPCRQELPLPHRCYRAHADQGLRVIAVASDDAALIASPKPLSAALAFPLARGIAGSGVKAPGALPANYVIGRGGAVRHVAPGAFDENALESVIGPLLAATAPAR